MRKLIFILLFLIGISIQAQTTFTIVGMPDTQKYTVGTGWFYMDRWYDQNQFIIDSVDTYNIAWVSHYGDVVDEYDDEAMFMRADTAMAMLETAGVPYSVLAGNNDGSPTNTTLYNEYFGPDRFSDKSDYGGGYGEGNASNYHFFEASRMKFMIVDLQYNFSDDELDWCDSLVVANEDRRVMVATHSMVKVDGDFSGDGQKVYDRLRDNTNVFLLMGGHAYDLAADPSYGLAKRSDTYNDHTIHSFLFNFQTYGNGAGMLRLMEFDPVQDSIFMTSYGVTNEEYFTDSVGQYAIYYDMDVPIDSTYSGLDTTLVTSQGFTITRDVPYNATIENNRFTSTLNSTYLLQSGDDGYDDATAHNLDGAVITGNYLSNPITAGTGGIHGIIAGYSLDYKIKYNYFNGSYYGVVVEGGYDDGSPMENTAYHITGNIFRNNSAPLLIAGYDSVLVYNNTYYNDINFANWQLAVMESNGTVIPAISRSIIIKNNIFYTTDNYHMINVDPDCIEGFVCDYNIYYCENSTGNGMTFLHNGVSRTFAQWQALGYDTHSEIRDPNFNNTIDLVPDADSVSIGDNLGTDFQYVLADDADWVVGIAPDTAIQPTVWNVGARAPSSVVDLGGYYVAPTGGSDSNPGTFTQPWATWQHAVEQAVAGDTVYFRGGVWYPDIDSYQIVVHDPDAGVGNNGTYSNHIVFTNYPGETPVLDCILNDPPGAIHAGLNIKNSTYTEWIGLTVRNLRTGLTIGGAEIDCLDINVTENGTLWFTNMVAHDSGGRGFWMSDFDTLYVENCDSYNRCDSADLTSPGGDADGFLVSSGSASGVGNHKTLYMEGCRAWNCSDDGIDLATSKQFYLEDNWTFFNGIFYDSGYQGDGTGIKTSGGDPSLDDNEEMRVIQNCLTTYNLEGGISELNLYEPHGPWMTLYNNTLYKDSKGYSGSVSGGDWDYDVDSASVVSRNNLIYGTRRYFGTYSESLTSLTADDDPYRWVDTDYDSWDWIDPVNHWYNEYNPDYIITDADFVELDSATIFSQLSAPRKTDGSLPDITVLKLAEGSDLIDGGVDVGLSFNGDAPDLGAFEYGEAAANDSIILTTPTMIDDSLTSGDRTGQIVYIRCNSSSTHTIGVTGCQVRGYPEETWTLSGDNSITGDTLSVNNLTLSGENTVSGDNITIRDNAISNTIIVSSGKMFNFTYNTVTGNGSVLSITFPSNDKKGKKYTIDNNTYNIGTLATFNTLGYWEWTAAYYKSGFDINSTYNEQ